MYLLNPKVRKKIDIWWSSQSKNPTTTLFVLLSFLLPTQLSWTVPFLSQTVLGFTIDYLSPTIYLTDILVWVIILVNKSALIKHLSNHKMLTLIFASYVLLNISQSDLVVPAVYKWLRVISYIFITLLTMTNKFSLLSHFLKPLTFSMVIVFTLAVLQFFKQGSLGGPFYLLGERSLSFMDPNVSGYPYSTFSHPNSLAGFTLVYILLLAQSDIWRNKIVKSLLIVSGAVVVVLSGSLTAMLTMMFIFILKAKDLGYKSKNLVFMAPFFDQRSIDHRFELIQASYLMYKDNWLFGVGSNNFLNRLPEYYNRYINLWELQPVHNIFVYAICEYGLVGMLLFIYLLLPISWTKFKYIFIAIILTGTMDHYWLTLSQNMLLFSFMLGFAKQKN